MNQHRPFPPTGPRELPTTQAAEGMPRYAWTLEQLDRLTEAGFFEEGDRVELIGGELVPMQAKGDRHELVKVRLLNWIARRLPEKAELAVELGWRPGGDRYLEPDLLIYSSVPSPAKVPAASVLLAIEIASSSLAYDRAQKASIYAALGVRDYWVIDAATLGTRVFRDPSAEGYATVTDVASDATLTPLLLPALALALGSLDIG